MVGAKDFSLKKNVCLFNSIGYISETSILVFTDLKMYSIFLLR